MQPAAVNMLFIITCLVNIRVKYPLQFARSIFTETRDQYAFKAFCKLLRLNKVVQYYSTSGCPHDNAAAESFFASMKWEGVYRTQYKLERQFRKNIDLYINFYNAQRPRRILNYKTPEQFETIYATEKTV